tara:strand:- start:117 stop:464 length:348 start_codon:yes stop_codon:yes gene_type:complete
MLDAGELQNVLTRIGCIDHRDQLKKVFEYANQRSDELVAREARSFARGDVVSFEHKGTTLVGKVEKINRKTIGVVVVRPEAYIGRWKVSPSLCSPHVPEVVEVDAPAQFYGNTSA